MNIITRIYILTIVLQGSSLFAVGAAIISEFPIKVTVTLSNEVTYSKDIAASPSDKYLPDPRGTLFPYNPFAADQFIVDGGFEGIKSITWHGSDGHTYTAQVNDHIWGWSNYRIRKNNDLEYLLRGIYNDDRGPYSVFSFTKKIN